MLIEIKVKIQLPITGCLVIPVKRLEQFLDVVFNKEGTTKNTHDLKHWSIEFEVMFYDGEETICDDGNMYLDSYGIFRSSPKGFDPKVLLNPFEKQLNLPPVSIQECNVLCPEIEVVGIVRKSPVQIFSIIDDSSKLRGVVVLIAPASESDCLVAEYSVCSIKHVLSGNNLIVGLAFLHDDKEGSTLVYVKEPCKVKVASVKYVAGQRLIRKPFHGLEITDICIGDSVEHWYLRDNVNLRVDFNAGFGASKMSPLEYRHTKINCCGVNRIKLPMKFEILCDSLLLCNSHHVKCELLKDSVISVGVCTGQCRSTNWIVAKTKAVRSFRMSSCYINKFPKAFTVSELAKHQYQKMTPGSRIPVSCSVLELLYNTPETALRKKTCHLRKNVFPCMHALSVFESGAKVTNSNPGHTFQYLKYCA